MEERNNIELFEVTNTIRVVFTVKSIDLAGRRYIELESPGYRCKPSNDQWRIKFLSVLDDGVGGLERYDYYYCNQKLVPGISLHIDDDDVAADRRRRVHVYQVIASVQSCPEFGVIGFQSRRVSQSYIKHPRMFSLKQLQHAAKDVGVVRICFEVSCNEERQTGTAAGPSSSRSVRTIDENVSLLNLYSFLEEGAHSDVTLRTDDGRDFKAHKLILAARSPVFATMFRCDMQESHTGVIDVNLPAEIVEAMLRFVYTNRVDVDDPLVAPRELFAAAHMYQLDDLQRICKDRVCADISPENVTEVLEFAERYSLNQVAGSALEFVSLREPECVVRREFTDYLVARLRPENVASTLDVAYRYRLIDFIEAIVKFIAKNLAAVLTDREYRDLYRTNADLILDVDERLAKHVVPLE